MSNDLRQLAEETMRLKYHASKLYTIFREICPEDAPFWWRLVLEESNHAALIKSGVDYFMDSGVFPQEILDRRLVDLHAANEELVSLIEAYDENPPSRETAFQVALRLKNSTVEKHFQHIITAPTDSKTLKLFQRLNAEDKDHAKRVLAYMKDKGIPEIPS